ncbi:hypothetical protein Golax_025901 [Gossypium laxum]|uniref:Uncharacterized protein n=1 Tax=Gossypium laxum TaxID=34288 RepID=A0A7J9AY95_9ROSI|nr:hypothetical protein [Gossypium laxum]
MQVGLRDRHNHTRHRSYIAEGECRS